jgi:hypothetical protein
MKTMNSITGRLVQVPIQNIPIHTRQAEEIKNSVTNKVKFNMNYSELEHNMIRSWMKHNYEDSIDPETGMISCTRLAEDCAWNSGLIDPSCLDDPLHVIWDLAIEVVQELEQEDD